MLVKVATIEVDLFDHLDLNVRKSWRALETDDLTADQIEALRTYSVSPKIIMIHPEDAEAFASVGARKPGKPPSK